MYLFPFKRRNILCHEHEVRLYELSENTTKRELPQEVEATNLWTCRHCLSLSLCLPFSNRVDIPHITGLDSLHPAVPALWCHKHTQAEEYEMEKAGAVGGWWGWVSMGTAQQEWSQRYFLWNQLARMTLMPYFLKYFPQLGRGSLQAPRKGWWVDRSVRNRHYKINEL